MILYCVAGVFFIFCDRDDLILCGRDDEQALLLLLQCGYSVEEALRRKRMNAGDFNLYQVQTQTSSNSNKSVRFLAWSSFRIASVTGLIFSASRRHNVPLVGGGVQGLRDGAQGLRQGLPQHPEPESWHQVNFATFWTSGMNHCVSIIF